MSGHAAARPNIVFDSARGMLTVYGHDGDVFETDGAAWSVLTPDDSPFAKGQNDFFAATWDSTVGRVFLFDPSSAVTWEHTDAGGWKRLAPTNSPPVWSVSSDIRRERDIAPADELKGAFQDVALKTPKMTFDTARGVAVMFYENALWEFDGASWESKSPGAPTPCTAATVVEFDVSRGKTVVFGCTVPGMTAEWDGLAWGPPGPGPYQAKVWRNFANYYVQWSYPYGSKWQGTLQLAYAHPNAAVSSVALGGVSTFDSDGTLRTWNGTEWIANAALPQGYMPRFASQRSWRFGGVPLLFEYGNIVSLTDWPHMPTAFFPPLIEDPASQRLLAFRDGAYGMAELDLADTARGWLPVVAGRGRATEVIDADGLTATYDRGLIVHPHPVELESPEHVLLKTLSDPASRETEGPPQPVGIKERQHYNFFWPFRLLREPTSGRVRLFSHRGVIWELTSERAQQPGEACESTADCVTGVCGIERVCCDQAQCGTGCTSCALPGQQGTCSPLPAGTADAAACGDGACGGVCSGEWPDVSGGAWTATCVYPRAGVPCGDAACQEGHIVARCSTAAPSCDAVSVPQACAGGLACADAISCRTGCVSRADCGEYSLDCADDGTRCEPDAGAVLAESMGISPAEYTLRTARSPLEIAQLLDDAGIPRDSEGRFVYPMNVAGHRLAFNPNLRLPSMGFSTMLTRLEACQVLGHGPDECVASMPRCQSGEPWNDDPAGWDCWPEACVVEYLSERETRSPGRSLEQLFDSGCYPRLDEDLP